MLDFGTLGGTLSYAYALNDQDVIVGMSETAMGLYHAFVWKDSVMTDMDTQEPNRESYAYSINNRGDIVGRVDNADEGIFHAVLWHNGTRTDLNCLIRSQEGMVLSEAVHIDDQGQIEAHGSVNWVPHIFRLTPN